MSAAREISDLTKDLTKENLADRRRQVNAIAETFKDLSPEELGEAKQAMEGFRMASQRLYGI